MSTPDGGEGASWAAPSGPLRLSSLEFVIAAGISGFILASANYLSFHSMNAWGDVVGLFGGSAAFMWVVSSAIWRLANPSARPRGRTIVIPLSSAILMAGFIWWIYFLTNLDPGIDFERRRAGIQVIGGWWALASVTIFVTLITIRRLGRHRQATARAG